MIRQLVSKISYMYVYTRTYPRNISVSKIVQLQEDALVIYKFAVLGIIVENNG